MNERREMREREKEERERREREEIDRKCERGVRKKARERGKDKE